ncbi:MAG: hypothetical protein ACO2ZP_09855, partial [Bacteriovoracaceae bacterium]
MAFKNALRKKFQGDRSKTKEKKVLEGDIIYVKDGYRVLPESNNGWGEDFYRKKLQKPNRRYKEEGSKDDIDYFKEGYITLPKEPKKWNDVKEPWRGRERRR